mgnify:CR=1
MERGAAFLVQHLKVEQGQQTPRDERQVGNIGLAKLVVICETN